VVLLFLSCVTRELVLVVEVVINSSGNCSIEQLKQQW